MTDPISHFSRMAQMDSTVRQAAKTEKRQSSTVTLSGDTAAAAQTSQADDVQLSDVARQATAQEPSFDQAKVAAIKRAIQQGQYPLDVRRIAESFVALEKMIRN